MEKISFYDEISRNKRSSFILACIVFVVAASLIYAISLIFAPEFSAPVLAFSPMLVIAYIYASYAYGDSIVLAATGAKEVDYGDRKYIQFANAAEGMSIAAGIPKPRLYVIPSDEINAFATGKDPKHASIAITKGALERLDRDEIEGVIGHEMSHIADYDIRFGMVVAVMVGLVAIISDILLRSWRYGGARSREERGDYGILILVGFALAIISPIIVRLVQLAISRKREFLADASSAKLTRYPDGLADALEKIKKYNEGKMKVSEAVSHLFISDPNKSPLDSLFATHPPLGERIRRLRAM